MAEKQKVTGLSKLIKGVQDAVLKAQHLMKNQHLAHLREYIDEEGNLQTVKVRLPDPVKPGQMNEIEVPKMALAPPAGLKLEKLKMTFEVHLDNLEDEGDGDHEVHVRMGGGLFRRGTKAKCELVFTGDDAPEGLMHLNDELVKHW